MPRPDCAATPLPDEPLGLNLAPGLSFEPEDFLIKKFRQAGIDHSRRSFRLFLKRLRVPCLVCRGVRYVWLEEFNLAMAYISMAGKTDFYCPGAAALDRGTVPPSAHTQLDLDAFRHDTARLISRLLFHSRSPLMGIPRKVLATHVRELSDRFVTALSNAAISIPGSTDYRFDRELQVAGIHPPYDPDKVAHDAGPAHPPDPGPSPPGPAPDHPGEAGSPPS